MFGVFIGEHENKIDSKFRLSIPADFRRELEQGDPKWEPGKNPSMAIVYGDARRSYLEVFTINDIMNVLRKIAKLPRGSAMREALQTQYATQAITATLDETGRIVLSAKVRDKLGLDGVAMLIGIGETFQIWKPETYTDAGSTPLPVEDGFDPRRDPSIYLPVDEG